MPHRRPGLVGWVLDDGITNPYLDFAVEVTNIGAVIEGALVAKRLDHVDKVGGLRVVLHLLQFGDVFFCYCYVIHRDVLTVERLE